ncbi:MAG TPA: hypothetical protein PKA62_17040, partial [Thermoanaerobaculia bacterium]|nr:hypothetical protein [Thermoanaerobaculia bacterium]
MHAVSPHLAVFRLADVAEVETVVDGEPADIRIEVFEDAANPGQFRCRTWRLVEVGLPPAAPADEDGGLDTEWETLFVPWWVPGGSRSSPGRRSPPSRRSSTTFASTSPSRATPRTGASRRRARRRPRQPDPYGSSSFRTRRRPCFGVGVGRPAVP